MALCTSHTPYYHHRSRRRCPPSSLTPSTVLSSAAAASPLDSPLWTVSSSGETSSSPPPTTKKSGSRGLHRQRNPYFSSPAPLLYPPNTNYSTNGTTTAPLAATDDDDNNTCEMPLDSIAKLPSQQQSYQRSVERVATVSLTLALTMPHLLYATACLLLRFVVLPSSLLPWIATETQVNAMASTWLPILGTVILLWQQQKQKQSNEEDDTTNTTNPTTVTSTTTANSNNSTPAIPDHENEDHDAGQQRRLGTKLSSHVSSRSSSSTPFKERQRNTALGTFARRHNTTTSTKSPRHGTDTRSIFPRTIPFPSLISSSSILRNESNNNRLHPDTFHLNAVEKELQHEQRLIKLLRYWMVCASIAMVKRLFFILPGSRLFVHAALYRVAAQCELALWLWVAFIPFFHFATTATTTSPTEPHIIRRPQSQSQRPPLSPRQQQTALFQSPVDILTVWLLAPWVTRLHTAVATSIPLQTWEQYIDTPVKSILDVLVWSRCLSSAARTEIQLSLLPRARHWILPGILLLFVWPFSSVALVYIAYILPLAYCYLDVVNNGETNAGNTTTIVGDNPTNSMDRVVRWLQFWVFHTIITAFIGPFRGFLAWLPLSNFILGCLYAFLATLTPTSMQILYSSLIQSECQSLARFLMHLHQSRQDDSDQSLDGNNNNNTIVTTRGYEDSRLYRFATYVWDVVPKADVEVNDEQLSSERDIGDDEISLEHNEDVIRSPGDEDGGDGNSLKSALLQPKTEASTTAERAKIGNSSSRSRRQVENQIRRRDNSSSSSSSSFTQDTVSSRTRRRTSKPLDSAS